MSDWTVICVLRSTAGEITHLGVDVPRGTQHVPLEEARKAEEEGRHRFYVAHQGDLLLLRPVADGYVTSADGEHGSVLARLPDCGTGARFDATTR